MKITTYQEAIDKVFVFEELRDYSLERMNTAMKLLNNPLKDIKIIHVAGTNGKGSVCKMVFSVLREHGKTVGCFTSPHLLDIRERFQTEEGLISEEEFIECVNTVFELGLSFSYFERTVLIGFLLFQKRGVEYAVVEVGCGGLYDSTNVVNPIITAITSIGLDHTKLLGDTLEKISYQKAGIIKPGIPVIYNHENAIIEEFATNLGSPTIFTSKKEKTNLIGEHQERNGGIAFEICKYILGAGSQDIISIGLQKVNHFGRLQYITENLIIDGAHNQQSLKELFIYLQSMENSFPKIHLCFSQKKGKSGDSILEQFYPKYTSFILVESTNTRIVESTEILEEKLLIQTKDIITGKKLPKEIYNLSCQNKNDLYVVFGSLYMIGEFLKFGSK